MEDLVDRMLLLAAWRKPAGPTPRRMMPDTYNTVMEAASEITRLREENKLFREALEWKPINTYQEGVWALFLIPEGERGNAVVETAMAFWYDGKLSPWTNGGPNSGLDYEFTSQPIYWREADAFTNYDDLLAIANRTALATTGGE